MNYLQALENRNLSKENLPKSVQNKMVELDSLNKYIEAASEISEDLLDNDEKSKIQEGKAKAEELQKFLIKKIEAFDQEVFDRKKASYDKMLKAKKEKSEKGNITKSVESASADSINEQIESTEPVAEEDKVEDDMSAIEQSNSTFHKIDSAIYEQKPIDEEIVLDDSSIYGNHIDETTNTAKEPVVEENIQEAIEPEFETDNVANEIVENSYEVSIENEQESLDINTEQTENEFEVEEFNKVETVKAKSKTISYVIIGVGAAIFTFGLVNLFKKK